MIGPWKRAVEAETKNAILEGQLVEAHDTIRHLSGLIADMKREGFNPPAPTVELTSEGIGLPNEVMDAIDTRAQTRPAREKLMQEARRLLRHADASEVAEKIMQGERFSWGA